MITLGSVSHETKEALNQVCPNTEGEPAGFGTYFLRDPNDGQIRCYLVAVTELNGQLIGNEPHFERCDDPVDIFPC